MHTLRPVHLKHLYLPNNCKVQGLHCKPTSDGSCTAGNIMYSCQRMFCMHPPNIILGEGEAITNDNIQSYTDTCEAHSCTHI